MEEGPATELLLGKYLRAVFGRKEDKCTVGGYTVKR